MSTDRNDPSRLGDPSGNHLRGRVIDGRYRIGSQIARGGMASVYEALDLRLDRACAVKVMHGGLGDDEEFAARFVREARAAARLDHPNVVSVYDQGEDNGTVFLVMEYVAGHTLRDVIRKESPMAPAKALALVEPVLSALAAAHRAHLIHRDIKPENVLIADDGRVKVADFGLAKAISADTQHTVTGGVLIGTVSYLAPEVVVSGRSDARADVYAAGILLYELLTGVKPHEGESPIAVAYKHVHEDVPAPSLKIPGLPAYVDALVARATARDLDQRPADAGVLLHQAHRVAQALAAGVREDLDLTNDLALRTPAAPERNDTAPDPFDADEFAALMEPAAPSGHTVAIERAPAPAPPPVQITNAKPPRTGRPRRPRRSRRGPILLALALLIAAGAGVAAWWFGWERYTQAPAVLNLSQGAAEARLDKAGLDTKLGEPAYSETVAEGRVIAADPKAGARVLDGGVVTLIVSLGKERYQVPKTAGMTEDAAQDELMKGHLSFGKAIRIWSETVPDGIVIRSEPELGKTLRPGMAVDLVVSKGRKPVKVIDFTGRDADRAEEVLEGKGLEVSRAPDEFSDTIEEGFVISQTPTSGQLYRGDAVTLVVSKGPELVAVPDGLLGSGVGDATDALQDAGFDVAVAHIDNYLGLGFVYSVDPDSGTMLPKGSTVTLYLI